MRPISDKRERQLATILSLIGWVAMIWGGLPWYLANLLLLVPLFLGRIYNSRVDRDLSGRR